MTDKNFHPVRHLLEKHRYTNFDDLKMGLVRLKREVERNDQAPIQFMRDNLDAFLQCYDHLSDILTCRLERGVRGYLTCSKQITLMLLTSIIRKPLYSGLLEVPMYSIKGALGQPFVLVERLS